MMTLIFTYILAGAMAKKKKEYAKKTHSMMHRTSFNEMYGLLSDPEKKLFAISSQLVVDCFNEDKGVTEGLKELHKVQKAPTISVSSKVYPRGFTVSGALSAKELQGPRHSLYFTGDTSKGPSIGQWLHSIVEPDDTGKDLMSPPPGCQPEDSMGKLGTEAVGPGGATEQGVIVEIRHTVKGIDHKQWLSFATDVFDLAVYINGGYNRWGKTANDQFRVREHGELIRRSAYDRIFPDPDLSDWVFVDPDF
jgi:hypothetical protein